MPQLSMLQHAAFRNLPNQQAVTTSNEVDLRVRGASNRRLYAYD
jgi:hypothetical protein